MSQYVTRCGICSRTLFFDTPDYPSPTLCQPCVVQAVKKHNDGETKKDSLYAELEEIRDSASEAVNAAEAALSKVKEMQGRLEE